MTVRISVSDRVQRGDYLRQWRNRMNIRWINGFHFAQHDVSRPDYWVRNPVEKYEVRVILSNGDGTGVIVFQEGVIDLRRACGVDGV